MSIPDDALRKVLFELQNRLVENNRQLAAVKTQISAKEREKRLVELTKRELLALKETDGGIDDLTTYRAVGKAFFRTDLSVLLDEHDSRITKAASELGALEQQKKYLERNVNESQTGLREVWGR